MWPGAAWWWSQVEGRVTKGRLDERKGHQQIQLTCKQAITTTKNKHISKEPDEIYNCKTCQQKHAYQNEYHVLKVLSCSFLLQLYTKGKKSLKHISLGRKAAGQGGDSCWS